MDIAQLADRLTAETAKIIYGKETQIRLIVMALLSQGHVLLEDLPRRRQDHPDQDPGRRVRLPIQAHPVRPPTCCPPTSWA